MLEDTFATPAKILTTTANVCRDYLRNVCYRDKRCKFHHLTSEELTASVDTRADPASKDTIYEFCHDFQNQGCDRPSCRFIHCSEEVEQLYHDKGLLPIRLKYEFELGVQELFAAPSCDSSGFGSNTDNSLEKAKPLCRDFIQRQCRRGKKCRFSHSENNIDDVMAQLTHMRPKHDLLSRDEEIQSEHGVRADKRMRLLRECHDDVMQSDAIQHMKDENMMLRKEVADLRKQVSGLSATNEVLLEQNAQFRLQKRCLVDPGVPFSQRSKAYDSQSTMSVSVPIAMSLSLPRQTQQQLTNTPQLAGAALINTDSLPAVAPGSQGVSVMTHTGMPGQAHIQFPQSAARIVNNISQSNTRLVDGLQSLTSHQAGVNPSQGLQANVPMIPQASITGANFSISQKLPFSQDLVWSIPAMTTSSTSHSILRNSSLVDCGISHQNTITLSQAAASQNVPSPNTIVGQSGHALGAKPEGKSLAPMSHNIAAQMTHAALVNSTQDPTSARAAAGDFSASIAAVAAQVIAAHAQPSSEMATAQISVPTVPCVTLAPAIVPISITTSLPVARMVSSLPLDNAATGLIATQIEAVGAARTTSRSDNSITFNAVNGHNQRVVSSQQQLSAPLNFTITQVPTVPQPQAGLHT